MGKEGLLSLILGIKQDISQLSSKEQRIQPWRQRIDQTAKCVFRQLSQADWDMIKRCFRLGDFAESILEVDGQQGVVKFRGNFDPQKTLDGFAIVSYSIPSGSSGSEVLSMRVRVMTDSSHSAVIPLYAGVGSQFDLLFIPPTRPEIWEQSLPLDLRSAGIDIKGIKTVSALGQELRKTQIRLTLEEGKDRVFYAFTELNFPLGNSAYSTFFGPCFQSVFFVK